MLVDQTLAALVDIEGAAAALEMSPALARAYLESRCDCPVATYKDRELWLSDAVHEALGERGNLTDLSERAAREAYERTEAALRSGEVVA